MKKKKISSKNLFTYVILIGLVALGIIYFMVFQKLNTKTDALKATNGQLKTEINNTKQYYDNREQYRQDTADLKQKMDEMVAEYPADAREEDVVMLAVDAEEVSNALFAEVNIDMPEVLYTVPQEEVVSTGIEGLTEAIEFVERKSTYAVQDASYTDIKNCIQSVYSNPNRIGISSIYFAKETELTDGEVTSNCLKGTIDVSFYSMTGTGKVYEAPDMGSYVNGTSNPFKLLTFSNN